jgi:hypothetical protein
MSDKTSILADLPNVDLVLQSELSTLFASSLTANGYQKLPGGLIIQWVTGTSTSVGEVVEVVNLPITFPTACLFAIASTLNSAASPGADTNYHIVSRTTSQITVYRQQSTGNSQSAAPLVLAIGY